MTREMIAVIPGEEDGRARSSRSVIPEGLGHRSLRARSAPFTLVLALAMSVSPVAEAADQAADQERALLEQDIGIALERQGRGPEAIAHYRAALALDPRLKAPWSNLGRHALNDGFPERAFHLANVALSLDQEYDAARRVAEEAVEAMPAEEDRLRLGRDPCPPVGSSPEEIEDARACLERSAGWLGGTPEARRPLEALGRLELSGGHAGLAALLLSIARSVDAQEPEDLEKALAMAGDPCGAASTRGASDADRQSCNEMNTRRKAVEALLADDLRTTTADEAESIASRIETYLSLGSGPEEAARRWLMDWRRGPRAFHDVSGSSIRLGAEWSSSSVHHAPDLPVWRRRPGDSALLVFRLIGQEGTSPEAVLKEMLAKRRGETIHWSPAAVPSTDPVTSRTGRILLDADTGGRIETLLWMIESPLAPRAALVVAGFPGTGGLGPSGAQQVREEILEAMTGAVLAPTQWAGLPTLEPGDDLPVPVPGQGDEGRDERHAPWRVLPAMGFTIALPPGTTAALPEQAPAHSAPRRSTAALWFRGRFIDRDGTSVVIGDERRAGSVDVLDLGSEEQARNHALARGTAAKPPIADPQARLITALDVTKTLSNETECTAAWIGRFSPSSGRFEWLVTRLTYASRVVEIALPVFEGSRSIALYWIPSTVRTLHGPPPPPPVDLSGRLGITFVRPPPEERRESFYKEGDLKSSEFTMIVPRGFQVILSSDAPDALPVKMSDADEQASARLDRWGRAGDDPKKPSGESRDMTSAPAVLGPNDPRLESSIREWLSAERYVLRGRLTAVSLPKPARYNAAAVVSVSFEAERLESAAAEPSGSDEEGRTHPAMAAGRAFAVESSSGRVYILYSLCSGSNRERRLEQIRLMEGSFRLLKSTKKESRVRGSLEDDRSEVDLAGVQLPGDVAKTALERVDTARSSAGTNHIRDRR